MKQKKLIIVRYIELTEAQHTYNELLQICLKEKGFEIEEINTSLDLPRTAFSELIKRKKRDYSQIILFSINFTHPFMIASLDENIPYIIWNEIHPREIIFKGIPANNQIYCFDGSKRVASTLNDNGITSFFLPIGYDQRFFKPSLKTTKVYDCSFVGNNLSYYIREYQKLVINTLNAAYPIESLGSRKQLIYHALTLFFDELFSNTTFKEVEASNLSAEWLVEKCYNEFCQSITSKAMLSEIQRFLVKPELVNFIYGTFVHKQRLESFEAILKCTETFALLGDGWAQSDFSSCCQGLFPYKELSRLYAKSRINFHIHRFNMDGINDRILNVTASAEFILTSYVDGLSELFDIGKEVDVYHCIDELEDKLKFYQANDSAREKIAKAGYERCKNSYRFDRMLDRIFETCDLQ